VINDANIMGLRIYTAFSTVSSMPFLKKLGFILKGVYEPEDKKDGGFPTLYAMVREPEKVIAKDK
jgi:hypothetical protein